MARLNIEEIFWGEGRLDRFAARMKWNKREAIGFFALLWHESQDKLQTAGTADEIAEWGSIVDPDESRRVVEALVAGKYIHKLDNGLYEIHGNEVQIENRVTKGSASAKGGEATKAKWAEIKARREAEKVAKAAADLASKENIAPEGKAIWPSSGMPEVGQPEAIRLAEPEIRLADTEPRLGSMQGNAEQGNAGQCSAEKNNHNTQSDRPTDRRERARNDPEEEDDHAVGRTAVKAGLSVNGLIALWNEHKSAAQPKSTKLTSKQRTAASAALDTQSDEGYWLGRIKQLAQSPFANGEDPTDAFPFGWFADLDYLIRAHAEIEAGAIDPKRGKTRPAPTCGKCRDTGRLPIVGAENGSISEAACPCCERGRRERLARWGPEMVANGWILDPRYFPDESIEGGELA